MRKALVMGSLLVGFGLLPALALAETGDPALSELVRILRDRGVLDEEQYRTLAAKAESRESEHWSDRIEMWGDFRARYEYFDYYDDKVNGVVDTLAGPVRVFEDDRHRLRYRLRLNAKGHVNDYADVFVRLTTGSDSRSTNETLGSDFDFGTNEIFLDKAYVRASPFRDGRILEGSGSAWVVFGRTPQPWRWSQYKDWIWDDEISPAGVYVQADTRFTDFELFGNAGYYVIQENAIRKDPAMVAAQVGFHTRKPESAFDFGGKLSLFNFFDLNRGFILRGVDSRGVLSPTFAAGNIDGGLTGDPNGGSMSVLEFGTYVTARLIDEWPITFYGNISGNFAAESTTVTNTGTLFPGTFRADRENLFWVIGGDIGDKGQNVRLRMLYAWMEANAFPSQFVDSDIHDGVTNRKGWVWAATRTLASHTDFTVTAFLMEPIETSGAYVNSLAGSERFRLQANVVYGF